MTVDRVAQAEDKGKETGIRGAKKRSEEEQTLETWGAMLRPSCKWAPRENGRQGTRQKK